MSETNGTPTPGTNGHAQPAVVRSVPKQRTWETVGLEQALDEIVKDDTERAGQYDRDAVRKRLNRGQSVGTRWCAYTLLERWTPYPPLRLRILAAASDRALICRGMTWFVAGGGEERGGSTSRRMSCG